MISPKLMLHTTVAACLASLAGLASADDEGVVRIPNRGRAHGAGATSVQQTAFLNGDKCAEDGKGGPCAEGGKGGPCGDSGAGAPCAEGGAGKACGEAAGAGPCGEGHDPNACAESGHASGRTKNGLFGGNGLLGGGLFGGGKSKGSHAGSGNRNGNHAGNGSASGHGAGHGHSHGSSAGGGYGSQPGSRHGLAHGNGHGYADGSGNGTGHGSAHGNGLIYRPTHPNDASHGGFGNGGRLFGQHGSGHSSSHSGWNSGPYGGPAHAGNELCNCLFGWAIPSGNCGQGLPLFGKYHTVYADNPGYVNPVDTQLYATGANGLPVVVPTAPNVNYQYNYSSGMPSSRITTLGTWNPQTAPQRMKFQTW